MKKELGYIAIPFRNIGGYVLLMVALVGATAGVSYLLSLIPLYYALSLPVIVLVSWMIFREYERVKRDREEKQ